ncbi:HAD-IIB family hydrolase [Hylemonella gracilis]|uniref:HAD-superfamily hydrolase, subfamily IIB n=1 Tax=Hylemonella gracilis ATCC 19624 TaxID=887062 RepID=F3KU68_9BURK|nr:HAD-IIB family hydrolase [Hylemonella gracilis]EGI76618.1 HAD-superfamily hydrolase, subfamily IIB [Hylemonella gracilis ATCC 19624]
MTALPTLLALPTWPAEERRRITGVLTDIDDTLTSEGAITPDARQALDDLREAGISVIPVTGRPIGWSAPHARSWPVQAIVAENGSAAWVDGGTRKIYQQDEATRRRNHERLQTVAQRVLREVPGAMLAQDSAGRETDIAIDHSEFTQLPPESIAHAVRLMQAEGLNATVSSIHINGWIGTHDKWSGARWIVRELLGRELDQELDQWVYIGDSTNDQLMFQQFRHSVGVANIARFLPELTHRPRYLAAGERGAGFTELAQALLQHRS